MTDHESPQVAGRFDRDVVYLSRSGFTGTTLALSLAGGLVAALGTVLVAISHHFHVSIATAGITLTANFAGALAGVLLGWWLVRRASGRQVLTIGLAVLALGLSLAALSPSWPLFAVAIGVGGVGFGAIDFAAVSLVSRTASPERASRLSVSAAGWGIGAIAGPLLIVVVRPAHFELFFWIAAGIGLGLITLVRGVHAPRVGRNSEVPVPVVHRRHGRHRILVTFLAAFCAYVALETAVAGWIATQLHGWGFAAATGSLVTAGFWAGLAVGRLGAAPVARRWTAPGLVVGGLAVTVVLLLAASVRAIAPIAYPLVGFAVAAVFPLGLDWFTQLSPGDDNGVASLLFIGTVGGILGSGAQNVAVAEFGLTAIPFVAAGLAVLCLAMFASARRFDLTPTGAARTPG